MSIQYVSRDEIEAHEAAMQRVVEDERKERDEIDKRKKRAIKAADDTMKRTIKASEAKMRKAIEAAERANDEAIKAAKKEADDQIQAAGVIADINQKQLDHAEKKLAAMQRDFERLPLLRQVYHEAPDDVFELIVSKCNEFYEGGWGRGGLNAFRLANKRCKQVVESCTTKLTNLQREDGPDSLPIPIIQRCGRIDEIRCWSNNLRSLEGCPDGLKKLEIGNAPHLSDLSPLASCSRMQHLEIGYAPHLSNLFPLASCSRMKSLEILDSSITDISVVSLLPLLEVFVCQKVPGRPFIKDISPLSSCTRLRILDLFGNRELKALSPLSACIALKELSIIYCPLITSLAPLSKLRNLKHVQCRGIDPQTSLLPLVSCTGLKGLYCSQNAVDLVELMRRRPDIRVNHGQPYLP